MSRTGRPRPRAPRPASTRPTPISSSPASTSATPGWWRRSTAGSGAVRSMPAIWSGRARPSARDHRPAGADLRLLQHQRAATCCACAPLCAPRARRSRTCEPVKLGIGLQTETGYPHEATLDYVASDVDQSTGTLQARGVDPGPGLCLPARPVRPGARAGRQDADKALLVPDRASASTSAATTCWSSTRTTSSSSAWSQIGALDDGLRVIDQGPERGRTGS